MCACVCVLYMCVHAEPEQLYALHFPCAQSRYLNLLHDCWAHRHQTSWYWGRWLTRLLPWPLPIQPTPNTPASTSNTHTHTLKTPSVRKLFFSLPLLSFEKVTLIMEPGLAHLINILFFPLRLVHLWAPFSFCQKCTAAAAFRCRGGNIPCRFLWVFSSCANTYAVILQFSEARNLWNSSIPSCFVRIFSLVQEITDMKSHFMVICFPPKHSLGRGMGRDTRL